MWQPTGSDSACFRRTDCTSSKSVACPRGAYAGVERSTGCIGLALSPPSCRAGLASASDKCEVSSPGNRASEPKTPMPWLWRVQLMPSLPPLLLWPWTGCPATSNNPTADGALHTTFCSRLNAVAPTACGAAPEMSWCCAPEELLPLPCATTDDLSSLVMGQGNTA